MESQIKQIQTEFTADLAKVNSQSELDAIFLKYLGKKGSTTNILKSLQGLTLQDKKLYGPILNKLKTSQESAIKAKSKELENRKTGKLEDDLTIPGTVRSTGHLHPTTIVIRELNSFFRYHGFSVQDGPEIEDVEYNFRRLNLPEGHPATDLQDTLFVKEPQWLMRTQTSSIEARVLEKYQPPMRVVVPGKVYRNETNSATNTSFFHHYQGFVVDKNINIQNLKEILTKVHQFLFGKAVVLRFRYKYYPEVSPGMGVDMQCQFCKGKGCTVCKYRGWIETLGSGIIHYNTMKASKIDPDIYTGYAFGMGLDRLVMNKFGIPDIRKLYGGELVYA